MLIMCSVSVQNIIAEHEIRNISCAAQDPEDLCTFAYITKDLQTNHHYCHVFSTVDVVRTFTINNALTTLTTLNHPGTGYIWTHQTT